MPKHFIKRITPDREVIRKQRHLRIFGELLHDANLWHINRRSSAGAFAIGLFVAFIPVPFQMILAAGAAILFRVNLPLSVSLVWITNPLTIPPIFFFAYKVGIWILGVSYNTESFDFTLEWFENGGLNDIWTPLLFGCFVCGSIFAALGYSAIRALWRINAIRQWQRRRQQRIARRKFTQE